MILQKHAEMQNVRQIQVHKNRYDGELGRHNLAFLRGPKRYVEITQFEFETLAKGASVQDLVNFRLKNHQDVEPNLAKLAAENPRVNL